MADTVPTLYEWMGGGEALKALIERFYEKVPADPLLAPLFAHMPAEHFQHVAAFIGEVLGGRRRTRPIMVGTRRWSGVVSAGESRTSSASDGWGFCSRRQTSKNFQTILSSALLSSPILNGVRGWPSSIRTCRRTRRSLMRPCRHGIGAFRAVRTYHSGAIHPRVCRCHRSA